MNSAIYLASRSPRRRELLKRIGVKFDPLLLRLASPRGGPDVDEAQHSGESPADYVERTAREKAAFGLKVLSMRSMIFRPVLAADTVVIVDGDVLAKPANPEEAASFMRRLSGRSHEVRTAVALAIQGPVLSATSVSTVSVRVLGPLGAARSSERDQAVIVGHVEFDLAQVQQDVLGAVAGIA